MEYFLYGVAEADHIIEQIKTMEGNMNEMSADIDNYQDAVKNITTSLSNLGGPRVTGNSASQRVHLQREQTKTQA